MHAPAPSLRPSLLPLLALFLGALLLTPVHARAQEPLPEEPATTLYRAAMELEAAGEYDLADSLIDFILREYPDSPAAEAIRVALAASGSRRIDSTGRTELVVWSTLYGLFLGVAVPGMLGADSPEAYGLGLLVGGPIGFFSAYGPTRDVGISDGDAGAITLGGTWGAWQGFGLAQVLDLGSRDCVSTVPTEPMYCETSASGEAILGSMVAGSAIGTGVGLWLARRHAITPGQATSASLGSLWGTWFGFAGSVLADAEGDAVIGWSLVGGNLGLLGSLGLANHLKLSRSDARIASIAGVAGALAGAGVVLVVQPRSDKVGVALPLVGSVLGLALGASRVDTGAPKEEEQEVGATGPALDWYLGGPVAPMIVDDGAGSRKAALALTLLSARF